MLTDALGFEVRVTLVAPKVDASPDMRRAARMTRAQARRSIADSMSVPIVPGAPKVAAAPARPGPTLLTALLGDKPTTRTRTKIVKGNATLNDRLDDL